MLCFQNMLLKQCYFLSNIKEIWQGHSAVSLSQAMEDTEIMFSQLSALSDFVLAGWIREVC